MKGTVFLEKYRRERETEVYCIVQQIHDTIVFTIMHYSYYMPLATILQLALSNNAETPATSDDTCMPPLDASSPLARARELKAPHATNTQDAEYEHASFWDENGPLLQDAWKEFEETIILNSCSIPTTGNRNGVFIEPTLDAALQDVVDNPTEETEVAVKEFWTRNGGQSLPKGVYSAQVLTESGINAIRGLLDAATSSGIPTRRPNGMNRHGVIVDHDVYGAVPMKSVLRLVEDELINRVVRPVGRLLFPDRVGCEDDVEYFAFTIKYDGSEKEDTDASGDATTHDETEQHGNELKRDILLKEHRDASVVTLNINLNLPHEGYAGSEVYFREYPSGDAAPTTNALENDNDDNSLADGGSVRFTPGMALIHLGAHRHGSLPISASSKKNESGKRFNLIIWLFGKDGDVRIAPYDKVDQINVVERWHGCNYTEGMKFV